MEFEQTQSFLIPELSVYDASQDKDIIIRNIHIDANYVSDKQHRPVYFDVNEANSYLAQTGKSLASLPLLVNIYIVLANLATKDKAAAQLITQLNTNWDRTATTINPAGTVVHADPILGEITYESLDIPLKGNEISDLVGRHKRFFQALLGLRDISSLTNVAKGYGLVPFYWYPRGERRVMFGGGDFYYMHQHIPGLLMVFCDDEAHPYRVLRGIRQ
ncbi:MAG: hypothetical protein PHN78_02980 [Dehalococcoidales bacterium]|nr:hypothetical protein [Dehalococcoidales bacterium]